MDLERVCKTHGLTVFRRCGVKEHLRCIKCRSEAVQRRRAKIKELAVEYKGGSCENCGYCKCINALEFHHTDPNEKDFGVAAKGNTRSFDKIRAELDKCVMLCANCHREEHARLRIE